MAECKPVDEWTTAELEEYLEDLKTSPYVQYYGDAIDEVTAILKQRAENGTYATL